MWVRVLGTNPALPPIGCEILGRFPNFSMVNSIIEVRDKASLSIV